MMMCMNTMFIEKHERGVHAMDLVVDCHCTTSTMWTAFKHGSTT